jgi:hypothetical protein
VDALVQIRVATISKWKKFGRNARTQSETALTVLAPGRALIPLIRQRLGQGFLALIFAGTIRPI